MLKRAGEAVGLSRLHPHALRHSAITAALKAAPRLGIGPEKVLGFSRHRSMNTLLDVYDDELRIHQGAIAAAVAESVEVKPETPARPRARAGLRSHSAE